MEAQRDQATGQEFIREPRFESKFGKKDLEAQALGKKVEKYSIGLLSLYLNINFVQYTYVQLFDFCFICGYLRSLYFPVFLSSYRSGLLYLPFLFLLPTSFSLLGMESFGS